MPLATKAVFTSNPLVIILLISSVPEMLFLCNFCLAGSNLFETNNLDFFWCEGIPQHHELDQNVFVQEKHVGISTVKCG